MRWIEIGWWHRQNACMQTHWGHHTTMDHKKKWIWSEFVMCVECISNVCRIESSDRFSMRCFMQSNRMRQQRWWERSPCHWMIHSIYIVRTIAVTCVLGGPKMQRFRGDIVPLFAFNEVAIFWQNRNQHIHIICKPEPDPFASRSSRTRTRTNITYYSSVYVCVRPNWSWHNIEILRSKWWLCNNKQS